MNGEQRRTVNSNWRTPPKNTCLYNVMCESATLQSQNILGENLYLFTIFRQTEVDILYFFTIFSQAQVYIPYFFTLSRQAQVTSCNVQFTWL